MGLYLHRFIRLQTCFVYWC